MWFNRCQERKLDFVFHSGKTKSNGSEIFRFPKTPIQPTICDLSNTGSTKGLTAASFWRSNASKKIADLEKRSFKTP
jgi:hypothetical protein